MQVEIGGRRSSAGCGCGGCLSSVLGLVMFGVIGIIPVAIISVSQGDSDAAALAAMNACPAATEVLGSPIVEAPWSMGCGESSSGGGYAHASWTISVKGPKGSASGHYVASRVGSQPWKVDAASFEASDGTAVVVVPCQASERAPGPKPSRPRPDSKPEPKPEPKGGKRKR